VFARPSIVVFLQQKKKVWIFYKKPLALLHKGY